MLGLRLMPIIFVLVVAASLTSCGRGRGGSAEKLDGTWVDADGVTVTFGPGNSIKVWTPEEAGEGTYAVNWAKTPAHLDVDWGKRGKVEAIVELTGDTLKVEDTQPGEPRPAVFTGKAKILKRSVGGHPADPPSSTADLRLQAELEAAYRDGMAARREVGRLTDEGRLRAQIRHSGDGPDAARLKMYLADMNLPEELDRTAIAGKLSELDTLTTRIQKARDIYRAAPTGERLRQDQAAGLKAASRDAAACREVWSELRDAGGAPEAKEGRTKIEFKKQYRLQSSPQRGRLDPTSGAIIDGDFRGRPDSIPVSQVRQSPQGAAELRRSIRTLCAEELQRTARSSRTAARR
jgi:uncharacterized protein (TIGR03067 family)